MSKKPKSNGHDKAAEAHVETGAARRSRRFRERKARGAVVIRHLEIGAEVTAALAATGWLHETEMRDPQAVEHALSAIMMRCLQAGVTNSGKALLEIDPEAIAAAWPWSLPGSDFTPANAAKALGTVAKAAE